MEHEKLTSKELLTALQAAFDNLLAGRRQIPTAGGQMVGCESWSIRTSGHAIAAVQDAIDDLSRASAEPSAVQAVCDRAAHMTD